MKQSKPRLSFCFDSGYWVCYQLPKDGERGSLFQRHELVGWGLTPKEAYFEYCSYA